jgi:hypothetical protein
LAKPIQKCLWEEWEVFKILKRVLLIDARRKRLSLKGQAVIFLLAQSKVISALQQQRLE